MSDQQPRETRPKLFNPNEYIIQLKSREGSKDYLPVQWRLVWFRSLCPQGTIETEELVYDLDREVEAEVYAWNQEKRRSEKTIKKARGYARYRAVVTDGKGGRATGTKSEDAANFPDFGEKAETGAIGRALAVLGYGTQIAPEFNEEHRIVDSPVEHTSPPAEETPTPLPPSPSSRIPSKTLEKGTEQSPVPQPVAQPKTAVTPVLSPVAEITWRGEILGFKDIHGPFEWRYLLEKAAMPPSEKDWTETDAFRLIEIVNQWIASENTERTAWFAEKQLSVQFDEITRLVKKFGRNPVAALKEQIKGVRGTSVTDLTRKQADLLLTFLLEAEPVFDLAVSKDPKLAIAKSLDKDVTHVLSFVDPTRDPQKKKSLDDYQDHLKKTAA